MVYFEPIEISLTKI